MKVYEHIELQVGFDHCSIPCSVGAINIALHKYSLLNNFLDYFQTTGRHQGACEFIPLGDLNFWALDFSV